MDAATARDELVPSVREIFDDVAIDAGLNALDDDTSTSDEDEAARDVATVMSSVRPLLRRYEQHSDDLATRLSLAQARAASATREARERSRDHLRVFERLTDSCTVLGRDLAVVGEHSSHSSCPGDRLPHGTAEKKHQEEENKGGIRRQAAAAAAAEADALAARHRSLVQRRRRMRSALRVLHVSEEAKVLLQSPEPVGQRGSRADEVIKSIELLRALLCENIAGDIISDDVASGELARVAQGRLNWLTQCLRGQLSFELANALRWADPLAAGGSGEGRDRSSGGGEGVAEEGRERRREGVLRVQEAMKRLLLLQFGRTYPGSPSSGQDPTHMNSSSLKPANLESGGVIQAGVQKEPGNAARVVGENAVRCYYGNEGDRSGGKGGGTVWALDGLLEPIAVRFRFHFEEDRATNRVDRPEWFLAFLLRALEAYRPLLRDTEQTSPLFDDGGVDPLSYIARGLALLARRRLRAQLGAAAADGSLLSHTIEEALSFDRQLDREVGYAGCPARFPGMTWPRCVEVFAQDEERFVSWMESDAIAAAAKLAETLSSPGAWRAVSWKNGPPSSTPVTPAAVALCRVFSEVTERYRPLRDPLKQLRFAKQVQEPVLRSFRDTLYSRGNECGLNSVFRDDSYSGGNGGDDRTDGIAAAWAAALGATALSSAEDREDKTPIGRWRGYCLAVSSCAYVCAALRGVEDDMLFAEMAEAAAEAAGVAGGEIPTRGRPSSMRNVGVVVGAAVGGVSQAVTSAAISAETATAGVARAVGAQGSIIGPTHAISAALTSLKGAARRVRMASAAPSVPSSALSDHNDVNRNGNGSGSGSGNDGENEYGADGSQRAAIDTAVLPASTAAMVPIERQQQQQQQHEESASPDEGVMAEDGGGGEDGYVPSAAAAVAMVVGQSGDFVFEDEAGRYGMMLEAMMRGAVASCRDGFLWCSRSYIRAWDRGIAVVIPASAAVTATSAATAATTAAELGFYMESSGRLAAGLELLATALGVAESSLPAVNFREFWTSLAGELDRVLLEQIVRRRLEMTQDEGLQLWADLKALMAPFSVLARQRPEKHFPSLTEAAILLSLEKSQLRSLSSGLDAHGGGVAEARRGIGWDGWRELGGSLSPEGVQMRDMLENFGVRLLGPAEASMILDKRIKGDRRMTLGNLTAAAASNTGEGRRPPPQAFHGNGLSVLGAGGRAGGVTNTVLSPDDRRNAAGTVGRRRDGVGQGAVEPQKAFVSSFS